MTIGGGLNGGFSSLPGLPDSGTGYSENEPDVLRNSAVTQYRSADPVDMQAGASLVTRTDLAMAAPAPGWIAASAYTRPGYFRATSMAHAFSSTQISCGCHGQPAASGNRPPQEPAELAAATVMLQVAAERAGNRQHRQRRGQQQALF